MKFPTEWKVIKFMFQTTKQEQYMGVSYNGYTKLQVMNDHEFSACQLKTLAFPWRRKDRAPN